MSTVTTFATIHNAWLSAVVREEIPPEIYTTCDACPMCDGANPRPANRVRPFNKETKCCTYWPVLPNYLVGSALSDTSVQAQEGTRRLLRFMTTDVAVPRGLGVPPEYKALYSALTPDSFGDAKELVCPYYQSESGVCTVWRHRNGVCATWHCKPRRGAVGQTFWEAAKALLTHVENSVSLWCALELGIRLQAARRLPRYAEPWHEPEETVEASVWYWGRWDHRRDEYYRRCFERASALSWDDVRKLGGIELEARSAALEHAFHKMIEPAPVTRAIPGPLRVVGRTDTDVFVQSYSERDTQRIDARVFHALRLGHGQTIDELRATARDQDGVELDDQAIRRLADLRILLDIA
jgi:hypothetical protein